MQRSHQRPHEGPLQGNCMQVVSMFTWYMVLFYYFDELWCPKNGIPLCYVKAFVNTDEGAILSALMASVVIS